MTKTLPLYDDPDPVENDEAEPTFWTPELGNAVDEELEEFYFKHLLVDDPEAACRALGRLQRALMAWSEEVESWGGPPEPDEHDEPLTCSFELEPINEPAVFLLTLVQATGDEDSRDDPPLWCANCGEFIDLDQPCCGNGGES